MHWWTWLHDVTLRDDDTCGKKLRERRTPHPLTASLLVTRRRTFEILLDMASSFGALLDWFMSFRSLQQFFALYKKNGASSSNCGL